MFVASKQELNATPNSAAAATVVSSGAGSSGIARMHMNRTAHRSSSHKVHSTSHLRFNLLNGMFGLLSFTSTSSCIFHSHVGGDASSHERGLLAQ